MSRVRIVCKGGRSEPDPAGTYPRIDLLPYLGPGAPDTHVYLVDDDGTEREVHGVERITWTVACDLEPARATLELVGVELDAEAEAGP